MAEMIPMLALSPTMQEGTIIKWLKAEGDAVVQGDVLCEIETDKATMEFESPAEGTLLKIVAPAQTSVAIGGCIAVIGDRGEDISAIGGESAVRVKSTPLARQLAKERGVEIAELTGSGPRGRIIASDVKDKAAIEPKIVPEPAQRAVLADETVPVSAKRKKIAERLSISKFTSPHYYLKITVIVDNLLQARERLNLHAEHKVSLNAFFIKLAAETLKKCPMINVTWGKDSIIRHGSIDIAFAVSQPDGLIAPVIRNCSAKGVIEIDRELRGLIEKARQGTLPVSDYSDSTFTISNLGSFGIEEFTAIINPPNSAILAIGMIMRTPSVSGNEYIAFEQTMKLTLCCDHRVIDGAMGAEFLCEFKELIEYPISLIY